MMSCRKYRLTHTLIITLTLISFLFINGPRSLCSHRKSNWIADRMKKLMKPRGGARDGRALFIAAGSVENLADSSEFSSDTHTPQTGECADPHQPSMTPSLFHTGTHLNTHAGFSQRRAHMFSIKQGWSHRYKSCHDC